MIRYHVRYFIPFNCSIRISKKEWWNSGETGLNLLVTNNCILCSIIYYKLYWLNRNELLLLATVFSRFIVRKCRKCSRFLVENFDEVFNVPAFSFLTADALSHNSFIIRLALSFSFFRCLSYCDDRCFVVDLLT